MLQSFIGTFDAVGLRSLRSDDDCVRRIAFDPTGPVPFWAVLDSKELPPIQRALMEGCRAAALELLVERAKSLGRLHR